MIHYYDGHKLIYILICAFFKRQWRIRHISSLKKLFNSFCGIPTEKRLPNLCEKLDDY